MTWHDIKVASLQKMFAIETDTIDDSDTVTPYLKAMPLAANEALKLLSTCGAYIKKHIDVATDGSSGWIEEDMNEITDFYALSGEVYYQSSAGTPRQAVYPDAENGSIVWIPKEDAGTYRIYYYAYPSDITSETADYYELPISPEAACIIPLYIASELYKEDDISMATVYRNEFESARAELIEAYRKNNNSDGVARFTNTTGWW